MVFFPKGQPEMVKTPFDLFYMHLFICHSFGIFLSGHQSHKSNTVHLQHARFYIMAESFDRIQGRHFLYDSFNISTPEAAQSAPRFFDFSFFYRSDNHASFFYCYRRVDGSGNLAVKKRTAFVFLYSVVSGQSGHRIFCIRSRDYFRTPDLFTVHVFHSGIGEFGISFCQFKTDIMSPSVCRGDNIFSLDISKKYRLE